MERRDFFNEKYVVCEDCECMIPADEAAPDNLCFQCFAERIADNSNETIVRSYLSHNLYDFISFLRENAYEL